MTGHPVRRAFFEIPPRRHAPPVAQAVLACRVVGTARSGCATVHGVWWWAAVKDRGRSTRPLSKALPLLAQRTPAGLRIIHQTGEHDYNEVLKAYQERGLVAEVHAFIDDMPGALAQADLVISRAGATAVAELAAAGRAALLIPFPGATDQHQLENARAMEKAGAARVIVQSELTPERLAEEIRELMASPATLDNGNLRAPFGQARRGGADRGFGARSLWHIRVAMACPMRGGAQLHVRAAIEADLRSGRRARTRISNFVSFRISSSTDNGPLTYAR